MCFTINFSVDIKSFTFSKGVFFFPAVSDQFCCSRRRSGCRWVGITAYLIITDFFLSAAISVWLDRIISLLVKRRRELSRLCWSSRDVWMGLWCSRPAVAPTNVLALVWCPCAASPVSRLGHHLLYASCLKTLLLRPFLLFICTSELF